MDASQLGLLGGGEYGYGQGHGGLVILRHRPVKCLIMLAYFLGGLALLFLHMGL